MTAADTSAEQRPDLRLVADAFRASMPPNGEVTVFRIDSLDRLGIPVVQANLIEPDRPATIGYGYGATATEAEVGAVGELCEEVHVGAHVLHGPRITGTEAALVAERGRRGVVDPVTLCLPAGSDYTPELRLTWMPARRWPSGEEVLVPREWIAAYNYQLDEAPRLIVPITNGLGAGFDVEHAIGHGLMELLQRDGNVLQYRALDQGVAVELDDATPPEVRDLIAGFEAQGIAVTVKLAASDFGMANLYVVGDDRGTPAAPIQISACGEACHPDRDRALRKAVLEFAGSRSRKVATHGPIETVRRVMPVEYMRAQIEIALLGEEDRSLAAMTEWVTRDVSTLRDRLAPRIFATRRTVPFSSLPSVPAAAVENSAERLHLLAARLAAEGLDILWVDCSPGDGPVKVVKVIVPGLESETMSYHRIGWRGVRRLRGRDDALLLDGPREGARRVRLRPEDEARAGGPAWFDAPAADGMVDSLYPMYRECGPFAAQLQAAKLLAGAR